MAPEAGWASLHWLPEVIIQEQLALEVLRLRAAERLCQLQALGTLWGCENNLQYLRHHCQLNPNLLGIPNAVDEEQPAQRF